PGVAAIRRSPYDRGGGPGRPLLESEEPWSGTSAGRDRHIRGLRWPAGRALALFGRARHPGWRRRIRWTVPIPNYKVAPGLTLDAGSGSAGLFVSTGENA